MRDLVYKNITSNDRTRRIIASLEDYSRQGLHTTVVRHFICIVRRIKDAANYANENPQIYVFKYLNNKSQEEKFFCRVRGSVCITQGGNLFLINFCHSVKIKVEAEKVLK